MESLNGKFKKECLDLNAFTTLTEARHGIGERKEFYNKVRPNKFMQNMTPRSSDNTMKIMSIADVSLYRWCI